MVVVSSCITSSLKGDSAMSGPSYKVLRSDCCGGMVGKKFHGRKRGEIITPAEASKIPSRRITEYVAVGILEVIHNGTDTDNL